MESETFDIVIKNRGESGNKSSKYQFNVENVPTWSMFELGIDWSKLVIDT
jgi:hypothetical protein